MDLRFIFSTLAGLLAAVIIFATVTIVRQYSQETNVPAISRAANR
jgi:hypothetical protein